MYSTCIDKQIRAKLKGREPPAAGSGGCLFARWAQSFLTPSCCDACFGVLIDTHVLAWLHVLYLH